MGDHVRRLVTAAIATAALAANVVAPPASVPASATGCSVINDAFTVEVDATYDIRWTRAGAPVYSENGTGVLHFTGTADLVKTSEAGGVMAFNGALSGILTFTTAQNWSGISGSGSFAWSAPEEVDGSTAPESYRSAVSMTIDSATCAYTIGMTLWALVDQQSSPTGVQTSSWMWVYTANDSGKVNVGDGTVSNVVSFDSDPCTQPEISGQACFAVNSPAESRTGSGTSSFTYVAMVAEVPVDFAEVAFQHREPGTSAWTDVPSTGTVEGNPIRLKYRLDNSTDVPVAFKLRTRDTSRGGFDKTTKAWQVTAVGLDGWQSEIGVLDIPGPGPNHATVTRTFELTLITCPTSAPCDQSAQRRTTKQVILKVRPRLTLSDVAFQYRAPGEQRWASAPRSGVPVGSSLRLVYAVDNRGRSVAFQQRAAEPRRGGFDKTTRDWIVTDPGRQRYVSELGVLPVPASTSKVTRDFTVSLRWCMAVQGCAQEDWRTTSVDVSVVLLPRPALRATAVRSPYGVDSSREAAIPASGVVKTTAPDNSAVSLRYAAAAMGRDGSYQLVVTETTPGNRQVIPTRPWREIPAGSWTMDLRFKVPEWTYFPTRTFEAVLLLCPGAGACPAVEQTRVAATDVRLTLIPPLTIHPAGAAIEDGGTFVPLPMTPTGSIDAYQGSQRPLLLSYDIGNIGLTTLSYAVRIRETTPGHQRTFEEAPWRQVASAATGEVDFEVPGATAGLPQRTFAASVVFCPSAGVCPSSKERRVTGDQITITYQ